MLRYQEFAVKNYSSTPDALQINETGAFNFRVQACSELFFLCLRNGHSIAEVYSLWIIAVNTGKAFLFFINRCFAGLCIAWIIGRTAFGDHVGNLFVFPYVDCGEVFLSYGTLFGADVGM